MTFLHPWVLWLLVIPMALMVAPPARRFGLVLPFDHEQHAPRRLLGWLLTGFDRVPAVLLAVLLVMLAGPQTLRQPKNTRVLTNIQFCLDVSGSMMADGRSTLARDAIRDFVDQRSGDAFGLTLFGSRQIRWTPLTTDLNAIKDALPFADPARQPSHMGGTLIGAALMFCKDNMAQEAVRGDRLIILVSDGQSSDLGEGFADIDHAQELSEAGITLFHIHVGSDDIPSDVIDIATRTGGQAFAARDSASLKHVFQYIDAMKPAQFEPGGTVPMDAFGPFAVASLVLLGVHVAGLLFVRYTPW